MRSVRRLVFWSPAVFAKKLGPSVAMVRPPIQHICGSLSPQFAPADRARLSGAGDATVRACCSALLLLRPFLFRTCTGGRQKVHMMLRYGLCPISLPRFPQPTVGFFDGGYLVCRTVATCRDASWCGRSDVGISVGIRRIEQQRAQKKRYQHHDRTAKQRAKIRAGAQENAVLPGRFIMNGGYLA